MRAMSGEPNACAASSISGRLERGKFGERRRPAEEVHRHDRLRPLGDLLGHALGRRFSVRGSMSAKTGVAPARAIASARRVERERGADHLVAAADLERVQDEDERVRPVRDADRLAHAEVARGLLLEGAHVRPEDELPALEDAVDRLLDPGQERRVLRLDVYEGDRVGHAGESSFEAVSAPFSGRRPTPRRGASAGAGSASRGARRAATIAAATR